MIDEETSDHLTDPADVASHNEMVVNGLLAVIAAVKAAQQQKPRADGTYEFTECEDCGDDIGSKRLEVAPMNLKCVICAGIAERTFKRQQG